MTIHNTNYMDIDYSDIPDLTQEEITKIIASLENRQCGYTTFGDIIQHVSEHLDIPENIAEWMIKAYRKENLK